MRTLVAACILMACAACGSTAPAASPDEGSFGREIAAVILEAEANGASDQQIAVLEDARRTGTLSTEAVRDSLRRTVQCMSDAGVSATVEDHTRASGLIVPGYAAALGQPGATQEEIDEAQLVVDACDTSEFRWVSSFYQTQPSSQELTDLLLEKKAPALRACLQREMQLGGLDQDATPYELAERASQVSVDTGWETDCLEEAGIDGF